MTTTKLTNLGYINKVTAGFQFDLNSTLTKTPTGYTEQHLCDHNCSKHYGNYDCPAAFTRNKGANTRGLMSFEEISESLKVAKNGLEQMNQLFLKEYFPKWQKEFNIPDKVSKSINGVLSKDCLELNMFGGNPELHPSFLEIIREAKRTGWKVCTTTTGKKFIHDDEFTKEFINHPPNLIAISADDYENSDELEELLDMDTAKLKAYWQKANPLYGQRRKAYESMYVTKIAQTTPDFCEILFNIVVHPGNLNWITKMLQIFEKEFPEAIINPYPAQSSFIHQNAIWQEKDLPELENFVDTMINTQLEQEDDSQKMYIPRLPYWIALKSIFLGIKNKKQQCRMLSGYDTWKCFGTPGAGRYLQAGISTKREQEPFRVGGHPGCFWNSTTITNPNKQLWKMKPEEIASYMLIDKTTLAAKADPPCPGCIMPRLMFDGISLELGLNSKLHDSYLGLRNKYFNF